MMGSVTQLSASKQQIRCADAVLLLVVPSVLFGIHAWLPAGVSSRLVFTYGDPTLTTVWTAAAIHDSPAHLTSNLGWYGLVVGATWYTSRGDDVDCSGCCMERFLSSPHSRLSLSTIGSCISGGGLLALTRLRSDSLAL